MYVANRAINCYNNTMKSERKKTEVTDYAVENTQKIEEIKYLYNSGKIDRDEAYARAKPILDAIDERGKVIAKKHGRKYRPLSFISLMR